MANALSVQAVNDTKGLITTADIVLGSPITTNDQYEVATQCLVNTRLMIKNIKGWLADSIQKAFAAHKAAKAVETTAIGGLTTREAKLNTFCKAYITERDRLKDQAAREQEWINQKHTTQREDKRIEAAAEAEAMGNTTLADAIINNDSLELTGAKAAPTVAVPEAAQSDAVSARFNWKARLTDIKLLCAEIAMGRQPEGYVTVNLSPLHALAKLQKQQGLICPGVECFKDPVISTR